MSKNKWDTTRKLKSAGIGITGIIIGDLMKIESLLSLIFMIENPYITAILRVAIPIIMGGLFWCSYWLYLKIMDWKKDLMERVSKLEEKNKGISANEGRIKQIENNQVVQHSINTQVIEFISEQSGMGLKELYNRYDAKHIEHIKNTNTDLSDGQASTGLNKCKGSKSQFHLILDKP